MNKKVRIGVFGAGHGMSLIHSIAHMKDAELVAVCDRDVSLLEQIKYVEQANNIKVALFKDFDSFINYDIDAVVLANCATEHAPYAIQSLKKGRHVLSALLPCQTMAEAVELVEAVEQTGLVYAYDENYCYRPDVLEIEKRYKKGDIGEVSYASGEYIHNSMNMWPFLTRGERSHWRNNIYATFYCSHSLGPLITITGLRPKTVVGFETRPNVKEQDQLGLRRGAGMLILTMENGAVFKTIDGPLKREPGSVRWEVYGDKGMAMTATGLSEPSMEPFSIYSEGEHLCVGNWESYSPENIIAQDQAKYGDGYGSCNFYALYFFVQKILGRKEGEKSIDIYTALDMSIPGILGYYSILDHNVPYNIPDFRELSERERWRGDNRCIDPNIASQGELLPSSSFGNHDDIPDRVYKEIKRLWNKKSVIY